MKVVVQRVSEASVRIDGKTKGAIKEGLLIFVGIENDDAADDVSWLASKIVNLRIFGDENGLMNLSVKEINGEILLISQFTLHAKTKKGNRPSFIEAAKPEIAVPLYNLMKNKLEEELNRAIQTGDFGADMKVSILNDGPVTIIIDTKNKS